MNDLSISRRAVTCAFATLPIAVGTPAMATTSITEFDRVFANFIVARNNLNNAPRTISKQEERRLDDIYLFHFEALNRTTPRSAQDFVKKFHALWYDGGAPQDHVLSKMLDDAAVLGGVA
jgi:hypothetical protein